MNMQLVFQGDKSLIDYKTEADSYVCSVLPDSPYHQIYTTPGTFNFSSRLKLGLLIIYQLIN